MCPVSPVSKATSAPYSVPNRRRRGKKQAKGNEVQERTTKCKLVVDLASVLAHFIAVYSIYTNYYTNCYPCT